MTTLAPDAEDDVSARDASYVVPGLERGLRILCAFSPAEPVLDAPELSRRLKIPRTTVFRLLQTLEVLGYLMRAGTERGYRLALPVLRLGFEHFSSQELTDLGLPLIESLRDDTGFTSHILIRDGRDVVFVAKAQSYTPVFSSVKVNIGSRLPAHASTHGHVLMGDLTMTELHALYPEALLQRFTPNTPATVADLHARIREDVERGYGLGESSFEHGISVVSAPVRNGNGRIAAVIATTIPHARITPALHERGLVERVCRAADELSARLNYRPSHARKSAAGTQRIMHTQGIE